MPKKLVAEVYDDIYCVKCKRPTPNDETMNVSRTRNNRRIFETHCNECGTKKTRFIKSD